jgi:uncharacterized protein (DUF362 family)/NAD-dependent dihydropyrimidine dehydrogenase PreA subunit
MQAGKIVSIKKTPDYDFTGIKQTLDEVISGLPGGWQAIVPAGACVLIKPNFLKPAPAEAAVSPHPVVMRAVVEACLAAGAGKIVIGDSPGFGTAGKVAEACGIMQVARDYGIEVVDFSESVTIEAPPGFIHRRFEVAREAAEADVIINLPKFKTHAMMVLTLAVKNLYGVIVGRQKARWHFQSGREYHHFARFLLELAYTLKPAVSILDAVVGMQGNGPSSGEPRLLGYLAASRDMVSLDAVAAHLAGFSPQQVYTLAEAQRMNFAVDYQKIDCIGDPLDGLRINDLVPASQMAVEGPPFLRPLSWLLNRFVTTRPKVETGLCRRCGVCLEACPAQCMTLPGKGPVKIDTQACIRCFCCQELCPEGALHAHDAFGVHVLRRLGLEG